MKKTVSLVILAVIGVANHTYAAVLPTEPVSLNNCQKAVASQAATFITNKETALRTCLNAISKLVIANQGSDVSGATTTCVTQFRKINDTRGKGLSLPEKLAAGVAKACDPSSNASLTHTVGDVLGAPTTLTESLEVGDTIAEWCKAFGGSGTMTAVADWTSCVSNAAECAVDTAISTQYPRTLEWLAEIKLAMQAANATYSSSTDPNKITDAIAGLDAVRTAIDGPDNDGTPSVACGQGGQLLTCQTDLTTCDSDLAACTSTANTCNAGTAAVADVLSGKTFSSSAGLGVTGTMPNNGAVTLAPGTSNQTIAAGYHNGAGYCAGDANLVTGNIKSGSSIFGVAGSPAVVNTSTGTATAADMASGKAAFVNGSQVTGSVPAGTNVNGANGLKTVTIPDGLYSASKTATANDTNLVSGNIKSGSSIFGVAGNVIQASGNAATGDVLAGKTFSNASGAGTGTMPNNGVANFTPGGVAVPVPAGYYSGGQVNTDASLVSSNIKSGATIFGVAGSSTVVDTSGATAAAADMVSGKTAYVNGSLVAGSAAAGSNVNGGNALKTFTIPDGLYSGSKTATANDTNLAASNIVSGVSILGVTGTALPAQPLRTGQTQCDQGAGTLGACPGSPAGQDGSALKGATRSYTEPGTPDGTITDNKTGLMWEKLSDDGSIHDKDNFYSWYTAFTTKIATLNAAGGFAGHTDWRLPNRFELETLVDLGRVNPSIDPAFNTSCAASCTVLTCSCTQSDFYWSATTGQNGPAYAWVVDFNYGDVYYGTKTGNFYVRAVRGGS